MKPLPARRTRSHLARRDVTRVLTEFAQKIDRWAETSHGGTFGQFAPEGKLGVHLLVEGNFGAAADFFEAMRILAGYRIPRDEQKHRVRRPKQVPQEAPRD